MGYGRQQRGVPAATEKRRDATQRAMVAAVLMWWRALKKHGIVEHNMFVQWLKICAQQERAASDCFQINKNFHK